MTEQMPGELIYEYTIQSTGATSYGVPPLDALLSGVADIPTQGARYDLAFHGPIVGHAVGVRPSPPHCPSSSRPPHLPKGAFGVAPRWLRHP
jgi:hypothetical protein